MLSTSASYRYASHDRVTYVHALLIACCNVTLHRIITCQGWGALAKLATSFLSTQCSLRASSSMNIQLHFDIVHLPSFLSILLRVRRSDS